MTPQVMNKKKWCAAQLELFSPARGLDYKTCSTRHNNEIGTQHGNRSCHATVERVLGTNFATCQTENKTLFLNFQSPELQSLSLTPSIPKRLSFEVSTKNFN
jgi:hypothetical protein